MNATAGTPLLEEDFLAKLEKLSLLSRRTIVGKVRGTRRSKRRGFSMEFADYRDYVPGDDLRYLDWNTYGRLERLFVKLFHEEEDLTVSILIDASASMADGEPEKLRYALRLAAALAYVALAAGDRVGIFPFASDLALPLSPLRGRRNAPRIFQFLGGIAASEGVQTRIEPSLAAFRRAHSRRGMVILISDLLDPAGFDAALRHVAGGTLDAFLIHVLSPQELAPPLSGDLRLVDRESGASSDVSITRGLLDVYRSTVDGFCAAVRECCVRRGLTALFASTAMPFEPLILGYLRSRGLLA
ncbi:MAG: DUF58 domain-containing protein [Planctomycetes bacterium]|nr:DUF58 domain-containing protein [Planctomycetota bacterium]